MIEEFFRLLGHPEETFGQTFNTALVHFAIHGIFET